MNASQRIEQYYYGIKHNRWYLYFAIFCRITLALGFFIAGLVKIRGERFASGLLVNNPMGHYLEALYYTEYYYTFIGVSQLIIAIMLLIPRTAALGALLYFPIILNICILTYAVRFEGTRAATLMLLANLYLLVWYYDRLKYILPFRMFKDDHATAQKRKLSNKFPFVFFGLVISAIAAVIVINLYMYDIRPGNSPEECTNGCPGNADPKACEAFCDCIYIQGNPLRDCLAAYQRDVGT